MQEMKKFDNIATIYDKYRPTYPIELINNVIEKCHFNDKNIQIADIGAGTGIFTQMLINDGREIIAIEPNKDMRDVLIKKFEDNNSVEVIDGSAENTNIKNNKMDLVTVAQAFHWFDMEKFRNECKRILQPQGKIFIVWNKINMENKIVRQMKEIDYKYSNQYQEVNTILQKEEIDNKIEQFFQHKKYEKIILNNDIEYDEKSFIGYNLSKSYSLRNTDNKYLEYIQAFKDLFDKYQNNGVISISNQIYGYLGEI